MDNAIIKEIMFTKEPDYNPMLDYLGEFSDEPGKYAIKHDGGRNTFAYFNADNVENMKQARQNYKRMMQYEKGEIMDYGVTAEAIIHIPQKTTPASWLIQKLTSGGLWGLSSDSTDADFQEVANEQLEDLKEVLRAFRFPAGKIIKASQTASWKE